MLDASQIEVNPDCSKAAGEVFARDDVLVLKRITVRYRQPVAHHPARRPSAVHRFNSRACPVARSLEGGFDIRTELEFG